MFYLWIFLLFLGKSTWANTFESHHQLLGNVSKEKLHHLYSKDNKRKPENYWENTLKDLFGENGEKISQLGTSELGLFSLSIFRTFLFGDGTYGLREQTIEKKTQDVLKIYLDKLTNALKAKMLYNNFINFFNEKYKNELDALKNHQEAAYKNHYNFFETNYLAPPPPPQIGGGSVPPPPPQIGGGTGSSTMPPPPPQIGGLSGGTGSSTMPPPPPPQIGGLSGGTGSSTMPPLPPPNIQGISTNP